MTHIPSSIDQDIKLVLHKNLAVKQDLFEMLTVEYWQNDKLDAASDDLYLSKLEVSLDFPKDAMAAEINDLPVEKERKGLTVLVVLFMIVLCMGIVLMSKEWIKRKVQKWFRVGG